jgi:hypothetical protein
LLPLLKLLVVLVLMVLVSLLLVLLVLLVLMLLLLSAYGGVMRKERSATPRYGAGLSPLYLSHCDLQIALEEGSMNGRPETTDEVTATIHGRVHPSMLAEFFHEVAGLLAEASIRLQDEGYEGGALRP